MSNYYEKPLSDNEFVELGELLASVPEPFEPMEPDVMDGFLTALLCLPDEPSPSIWMPYIFDAEAREGAGLSDAEEQDRLEELIYRRYRTIDKGLARCRKLDPIIYEIVLILHFYPCIHLPVEGSRIETVPNKSRCNLFGRFCPCNIDNRGTRAL